MIKKITKQKTNAWTKSLNQNLDLCLLKPHTYIYILILLLYILFDYICVCASCHQLYSIYTTRTQYLYITYIYIYIYPMLTVLCLANNLEQSRAWLDKPMARPPSFIHFLFLEIFLPQPRRSWVATAPWRSVRSIWAVSSMPRRRSRWPPPCRTLWVRCRASSSTASGKIIIL